MMSDSISYRKLTSTHGFIEGDLARCGKAQLLRDEEGQWTSNGFKCNTEWLLILNPKTTFYRKTRNNYVRPSFAN